MSVISKGFSLIELMIVIAIIGILAAIAVPSYQTYVKKAKVVTAISAFQEAGDKLQLYYYENGSFPNCITWRGNEVCNFQHLPVTNFENAASIFYWSIGLPASPITGGAMIMYGIDVTEDLGGGLM